MRRSSAAARVRCSSERAVSERRGDHDSCARTAITAHLAREERRLLPYFLSCELIFFAGKLLISARTDHLRAPDSLEGVIYFSHTIN
jgi:hypothetical protein